MDILPADIIRHVFLFTVDNKTTDVDSWKIALPLMAINRVWRAATASRIYKTVLFCCTSPEYDQIDINTNITLVEQNGFLEKAKRLTICDYTSEYQAGVMQHIAAALPAQFAVQNHISTISRIALNEDNVSLVGEDQILLGCAAAGDIAKRVKRHLPSINDLTIQTFYPHPIYLSFLETIMESYGGRLINLMCDMPANTLGSARVDKMSMFMLPMDGNIDGALSRVVKSTIKPQSLQRIQLAIQDIPFAWDLFIPDFNSGMISFDSLTYLYLAGDRFVEYEERDGRFSPIAKVWPKLAFPQLASLTIFELPLTDNAVEIVMSAPLKKLSYKGQSAQARLLCRYKINTLNYLTLNFDMSLETSIDDFYRFSNEIFSRTSEIPIVQCSIYDQNYKVDWSKIEWPHVTHLSITQLSNFGFVEFLAMIPAMPNLVELSLAVTINHNSVIPPLVATLNDLKKTHTQPLSSKIKKLIISLLGLDESLDQALEELKWYLPKLEQIVKLN